jgi:hypothetical protein
LPNEKGIREMPFENFPANTATIPLVFFAHAIQGIKES